MKINHEIITEISDGEIKFKSGKVLKFTDEHSRDCCERVYADLSLLPLYAQELQGKYLNNISIRGIKDEGFIIEFMLSEYEWDTIGDAYKVFIGCYNEQNGYYGSDLVLIISYDGEEERIDISDFKEDRID